MAELGDAWSAEEVDAALRLLDAGGGKLRPGHQRLPAELAHALQRERLLAAMHRAAAELGYRALNVQDVINRAGVSRPTFYEHFANKEACFLAALDSAATRLSGRVEGALEKSAESRQERIRAGLEVLLHFVREEPDAARTLIVEARGATPQARLPREALLDRFAGCLDEQLRKELSAPPAPTASTAVVGGIESLLFSHLYEGRDEEIDELLPTLSYLVALLFETEAAKTTDSQRQSAAGT